MLKSTTYCTRELPDFCMNAGETKYLRFPVYDADSKLVDVSGMQGRLAISDYINRGQSLFHIDCEVSEDDTYGGNVFTAVLLANATLPLCGKFIYQLTIRDTVDAAISVLRGVVMIAPNADQNIVDAQPDECELMADRIIAMQEEYIGEKMADSIITTQAEYIAGTV